MFVIPYSNIQYHSAMTQRPRFIIYVLFVITYDSLYIIRDLAWGIHYLVSIMRHVLLTNLITCVNTCLVFRIHLFYIIRVLLIIQYPFSILYSPLFTSLHDVARCSHSIVYMMRHVPFANLI